jgi:hypothetical protein
MTLQNAMRSARFALPLALVAACSDGGSHHHAPTFPGATRYYEVEPNGHPSNANFIGPVSIGDYFVISGQVSDFYQDWFDGFWMWATEDVDVEFVLTAGNSAADLDLGWYDPAGAQYVAKWETAYNPEIGVLPLYADEDFHLVVTPWVGTSTYTLEVIGHPIGYAAPQGAAPAASAATREREVPFDRYHRPEPAPEPEEPQPVALGRVIEVDPEDGSLRSLEFELTTEGLRVGPLRLGSSR